MKTEAQFTVDGIHIRDRAGRHVLPRGCNLGGDSKMPLTPPGNPLSFDVSFTGRPFPEAEADEHFARLALWGFTFLRFVITWEAVEHAGPGVYDEDYLAYLRSILKKAEAHGISVFIDPHQDAWSRWTGGDGAPGWTLEAAGFDLSKIIASGAAFTVESEGNSYVPMSWGLNYLRYAAATMNTLFFGGNAFAPGRLVEGLPIQEFLQGHFIAAMRHTARRLKDCNAIIGFGIFNEPHYGFIQLPDLNGHHRIHSPSGSVPSAFQAIAAASGFPQKIRRFTLAGALILPGKTVLNGDGVSLFREGFECPWKEAGVWAIEDGEPVLKHPGYFARIPAGDCTGDGMGDSMGDRIGDRMDKSADFAADFLKPFQKRFMEEVSVKHEHYLFFVEGVPFAHRVSWKDEDRVCSDGTRFSIVEASHWYDGLTLIFKKWRPWFTADSETRIPAFGARAVCRSMENQLDRLACEPRIESLPVFLGEFGVPFDLSGGRAYGTDDYSEQEEALGVYYDAVDAALLPSTIWNYSASNTHVSGDGWNTEDLSIYSRDSGGGSGGVSVDGVTGGSGSGGGGRAVRGFSRPYAMAVAGLPLKMRFDRKKRVFSLEWEASEGKTEVFVPAHWYPEGWGAGFTGGNAVLEERPDEQRLFVQVEGGGKCRVSVFPADPEAI